MIRQDRSDMPQQMLHLKSTELNEIHVSCKEKCHVMPKYGVSRDAQIWYITPKVECYKCNNNDPRPQVEADSCILVHEPASATKCNYLTSLREPTETSKKPIKTRYLRHVTGYQPIRDQPVDNGTIYEGATRCFMKEHIICDELFYEGARVTYQWYVRTFQGGMMEGLILCLLDNMIPQDTPPSPLHFPLLYTGTLKIKQHVKRCQLKFDPLYDLFSTRAKTIIPGGRPSGIHPGREKMKKASILACSNESTQRHTPYLFDHRSTRQHTAHNPPVLAGPGTGHWDNAVCLHYPYRDNGNPRHTVSRRISQRGGSEGQKMHFSELVLLSPTQIKLVPIDRSYQGDQVFPVSEVTLIQAFLRFTFILGEKLTSIFSLTVHAKTIPTISSGPALRAGPNPEKRTSEIVTLTRERASEIVTLTRERTVSEIVTLTRENKRGRRLSTYRIWFSCYVLTLPIPETQSSQATSNSHLPDKGLAGKTRTQIRVDIKTFGRADVAWGAVFTPTLIPRTRLIIIRSRLAFLCDVGKGIITLFNPSNQMRKADMFSPSAGFLPSYKQNSLFRSLRIRDQYFLIRSVPKMTGQKLGETSKQHIRTRYLGHVTGRSMVVTPVIVRCYAVSHEPNDTSKQPIRTRYLGHVTCYHPLRDQYFLIQFLDPSISHPQGSRIQQDMLCSPSSRSHLAELYRSSNQHCTPYRYHSLFWKMFLKHVMVTMSELVAKHPCKAKYFKRGISESLISLLTRQIRICGRRRLDGVATPSRRRPDGIRLDGVRKNLRKSRKNCLRRSIDDAVSTPFDTVYTPSQHRLIPSILRLKQFFLDFRRFFRTPSRRIPSGRRLPQTRICLLTLLGTQLHPLFLLDLDKSSETSSITNNRPNQVNNQSELVI
eukprot:sb/3461933/